MKWLDPNNPFDNSYYGEKRPSTWKIILCGLGLFIVFLLMFEGLARILFCSATLIFTAITVWLEHHQKRAANMLDDEFKDPVNIELANKMRERSPSFVFVFYFGLIVVAFILVASIFILMAAYSLQESEKATRYGLPFFVSSVLSIVLSTLAWKNYLKNSTRSWLMVILSWVLIGINVLLMIV